MAQGRELGEPECEKEVLESKKKAKRKGFFPPAIGYASFSSLCSFSFPPGQWLVVPVMLGSDVELRCLFVLYNKPSERQYK